MTEERDIAGFVLPFTLGLALTTLIQHVGHDLSFPLRSISLILTFICLHTLTFKSDKTLNVKTLWTAVITLGLCCGVLCCEIVPYHFTSISEEKTWISELASDFCQKIKSEIADIPFENSRTNAIATTLITGDRSSLQTDTVEAFRLSGASHILALSGMHLGIIYGLLKILLQGLGNSHNSKIIKSGLVIICCGFYALSTGAGASIVRAFIFIMMTEAASVSGRRNSLKTIMFSSLLIQLILTPGEIENVGFQLSYAAIAGIAYIYPWLKKFWPNDKKNEGWTIKSLKWTWNCASLSIACQITTAPIAFAYFGTFPKYFLITNLIALPLTTLIIQTSLLTLVLSAGEICPNIVIRTTEALIEALIYCLTIISSL